MTAGVQLLPIEQTSWPTRRLLVTCPRERRSVGLERCLACPRGRGIELAGAREVFFRCAVHDAAGVPAGAVRQTLLREIMTVDVQTVARDTDVETIAWTLAQRGFGGLPVTDADGHLLGIVTATDLLRAQLDGSTGSVATLPPGVVPLETDGMTLHLRSGTTAADVMTPVVFTLPPDVPVAVAAALMALERVHRVPIVEDGVLVGIVSSLDVMRWLARVARYVVPGID